MYLEVRVAWKLLSVEGLSTHCNMPGPYKGAGILTVGPSASPLDTCRRFVEPYLADLTWGVKQVYLLSQMRVEVISHTLVWGLATFRIS